MPVVALRDMPTELHRELKRRAESRGRTIETEIKAILEQAVLPDARLRIGSELAALGRNFHDLDLDIARDAEPGRSAAFD